MPPVRPAAGRSRRRLPSLTVSSLAALALGLSLGVLGHASKSGRLQVLERVVGPIGDLWLSALRMTVLPLVIVLVLAAVVGTRRAGSVEALAGRAVLLFAAMLVGYGILTLALTPLAMRIHPLDSVRTAALASVAPIPEAARRAADAGHDSIGRAVAGSIEKTAADLLPRNVFQAALRGDLLPLLLFTALFGIAVTRLPHDQREPLTRLFQSLAAVMLQCVRWVLFLMPAGVFAFTFRFALASGSDALDVLGTYVAIVSGLMLLCTALLYPLTSIFGRTTMRGFARAVAPAQLVAVTTRSSIASLPALVEGARDRLCLPDSATGVVLPLAVAVFKLEGAVANAVKLVFLAHIYGVSLGVGAVAAFMVNVIILSFSTPGIPSAGTFRTLPAYLAAGVPIEGVVIVYAVETIPDIFMTLLNVTGDMSAATLMSRSARAVGRGNVGASSLAPAASDAEAAGS